MQLVCGELDRQNYAVPRSVAPICSEDIRRVIGRVDESMVERLIIELLVYILPPTTDRISALPSPEDASEPNSEYDIE